jgi:hypothetical protein
MLSVTYNLQNFVEEENSEARIMVRIKPYDYTKFSFKKRQKSFES